MPFARSMSSSFGFAMERRSDRQQTWLLRDGRQRAGIGPSLLSGIFGRAGSRSADSIAVGQMLLMEQLCDELAPAPDTDLGEDRLQMVLNGIDGDVELRRDAGRRGAGDDTVHDLPFTAGQPV